MVEDRVHNRLLEVPSCAGPQPVPGWAGRLGARIGHDWQRHQTDDKQRRRLLMPIELQFSTAGESVRSN